MKLQHVSETEMGRFVSKHAIARAKKADMAPFAILSPSSHIVRTGASSDVHWTAADSKRLNVSDECTLVYCGPDFTLASKETLSHHD